MSVKSSLVDKDFGDNAEPSVLSEDPNERKLARRLRMQRRIEALQKYVPTQYFSLFLNIT